MKAQGSAPGPRLRQVMTALVLGLLAAGTAPASAQTPDQYLVLTKPSGWQRGQAIEVPPGATVEIEGFVAHPAGVSRVLVDGIPATLEVDPAGPVHFVAKVTAGARAKQVVITVEPKASRAFSRSFALGVAGSGSGAATPASAPATAVAAAPSSAARSDTATRAAPPRSIGGRSSPWRPYGFRSVGYAGALGAGVFLATKQTTDQSVVCTTTTAGQDCFNRTQTKKPTVGVGLGLAGAAAGIAILDAVLTSHRAHADGGTRTGALDAPAAGVHLALTDMPAGAIGIAAVVPLRF